MFSKKITDVKKKKKKKKKTHREWRLFYCIIAVKLLFSKKIEGFEKQC